MKKGTITVTYDKVRKRWKVTASATASPTGKMTRRWFEKRVQANAERDRLKDQKDKHGVSGRSLPPDLAADAARAAAILEPFDGATLTAAAKLYADTERQKADSITFAELFDAYANRPNKRERRPATLTNWQNTYNKYEPLFGERKISEVTAGEIEKRLDTFTPHNAAGHYRHLRSWFNYAVKKRWVKKNPMLFIDITDTEIAETKLLTNKQSENLLNAAGDHYPELVPYVAFGMFAGVRPSELLRLDWKDVNLADGVATITTVTSKTTRRQNITICDALAAWLAPHAKKAGPICDLSEREWKAKWGECRQRVGLFEKGAGKDRNAELWPKDVMRKTFASCHLAAHRDLKELQIEMRHTGGLQLLNDHYLNVVARKDGIAFWQIVPEWCPKPAMIKAA